MSLAFLLSETFWVAISAFVAAVAIVVGVIDRRKIDRASELRNWQAVTVQKAMQRHGKIGVGFDQILQDYRVEATAVENLSKKALSANELRRVLIELMVSRVIHQKGNDSYALAMDPQFDDVFSNIPQLTTGMASIFESGDSGAFVKMAIGAQKTQQAIYSMVGSEPFKYSAAEIALKIADSAGGSADQVRSFIFAGLAKKEFTLDQHQRVGLGDAPVISAEVR